MIWIAYGMGFVVGVILLAIFVLQVLYAMAEYHERAHEQPGAAQPTEMPEDRSVEASSAATPPVVTVQRAEKSAC